MSLLKFVVEMTDGTDADAATRVQRESTAPLLTRPTVAVPLLHVDESPADADDEHVDVRDEPADDVDDVADSGCCFEEDVDNDYAADDYMEPVYKTDVQKGQRCRLELNTSALSSAPVA